MNISDFSRINKHTLTIMIVHVRSMPKAGSNLYRDNSREIKRDKGMSATWGYSGGILESRIICCEAAQEAQVCQPEI